MAGLDPAIHAFQTCKASALFLQTPIPQSKKSFLLLFFKKEVLSYGFSFAF